MDIRKLTEEYSDYLRDESRTVGSAQTISFPRTQKEICEIMKHMYEDGTPVTIQGSRTGLAGAASPQGGHIMNLSAMNKVNGLRQDESGNWYMTVEPGLTLTELKKIVGSKTFDMSHWTEEQKGIYTLFAREKDVYFFSPDPTETSAAIGGMVACNASGARTYLYGPTRNWVSALKLVLADGSVITLKRGENFSKGRSASFKAISEDGSARTIDVELADLKMPNTKNASGYYIEDDMDLIDLIIGSDGTLGVISEIEIMLQKQPSVIWGVSCLFGTEKNALDFAVKVRESLNNIASIEFFDNGALNVLREQRAGTAAFAALPYIPESVNNIIYCEIHCGSEDEAKNSLFTIGEIMETCGENEGNSWVARDQSELDRLMFFRHAVPESVNMFIDRRRKEDPSITKLGTDMSVPDSKLYDAVAMYRKGLEENDLQSATWGHLGNNHLHVNVLPRNKEDFKKAKAMFLHWAQQITLMGGAVSAEHGVGKIKAPFLTIMYGEEQIEKMRAMKLKFDPKYMLGRGNLFEYKEEAK